MNVALHVAAIGGSLLAGLRWWRVAQREHYLAGSATRFALRWWRSSPANLALGSLTLAGLAGSLVQPWLGWLAVVAASLGPLGLGIRGRTAPISWTDRLLRLVLLDSAMVLAILTASFVGGRYLPASLLVAAMPLLVDLGLYLMAPVERTLGQRFVDAAEVRLAAAGLAVVAITGSYGKTTTKGYVAHLLSGRFSTVASPASFNNRMGLARAINEHVSSATRVFVAEMGTYGAGEIAELCAWIHPKVSVITAVGPVHLERFGTEERIVAAKREILVGAEIGVINVDHPGLAVVAAEEKARRRIITTSTASAEADVAVIGAIVMVGGKRIATIDRSEVFAANLACAVGVGLAMDMTTAEIAARLPGLTNPAHRRQMLSSGAGFTIIDDTYNSNPAGADSALDLLAAGRGRKVVVTPGMVELGSRQREANREFAVAASSLADDVVVIGATNRAALVEGAASGRAAITVLPSRQEAIEWVRARLGPGDTVLYENDLPDHYP